MTPDETASEEKGGRGYWGFVIWPVVFVALSLLFCGFQCDVPKTRPIAALAGNARKEKVEETTIESVFEGVGDILRARGFTGGRSEQPSAYHLTGARIYEDGFSMTPSFGCTVLAERKGINIGFYEWERPRHSGIFPSTEEERLKIQQLVREIEDYLRSGLPASCEFHVSFEIYRE